MTTSAPVHILVVEDSPTQAAALKIVLEGEGFAIDVARDGEAGLARVRERTYDLVLCDVVMPGISGYDLCAKMKADPRTRDVPLILLTTLSEPVNIVQGLECGADNFITKPYEPAYLVSRIRNMLKVRELLAEGLFRVGVDVLFMGRKFTITSEKHQVLSLLMSTFEEIIRASDRLKSANAELEGLYERVKELDELKTRFFENVSHELRTPLTLILGPVRKLLAQGELSLGQRHELEVVARNAQTMLARVNDLLDIAKLDAGRMGLRYAHVDLARLVRVVSAHFESLSSDRGIRFTIEAPESLPAEVDAEKMERVLLNLLSNAFKFTPDGGRIRVELEASGRPAPGTAAAREVAAPRGYGSGMARIEVGDSGPGVPPAVRATIF
ncbi:MAG TPA: hybrid sensor histidine kinase/response regulator, partial [Planctomycetota bacterium]|nr:hybrid sensor histidine kinase/response regulator [Planctomycetota bacterium]